MEQPKTLCIYHDRDLDGLACAALFKRHFGKDAALLGWDYSYNPEELITLIKTGNYNAVCMADVSLPMVYMAQIVEQDLHFLWVDHHKSAIDDYLMHQAMMPARKRETVLYDGLSACELLYCRLNNIAIPPGHVPAVIELLGRYDTWRQDGTGVFDWNNVLAFQVAMKARWDNAIHLIERLLEGVEFINTILNEGRAILRFERAEMEQNAKNAKVEQWAYEYHYAGINEQDGISTVVLNTSFNPGRMADVIWPLYPDARLLVCYSRAADGKWNYSLRSPEGGADCSKIAKHFGGGGHFHAAGFQSKELLF